MGDHQVQVSIVLEVEEPAAPAGHGEGLCADAGAGGAVPVGEAGARFCGGVEGVGLVGEMGDEEIQAAVLIGIAERDAHPGLCFPGAVERQAARQGLIGEAPIALIDPELVGLHVVGDVDVNPAIPGQIEADHPVAGQALGDPRLGGYLGEAFSTLVAVEGIPDALESVRSAIVPFLPEACPADPCGVVAQVMADEKIEIPVTVVVEKRG